MVDFKTLLAYFQGTEEPTPGKKRYPSDPKLVDQARHKTPLFRNYDYVEDSTGPGAGYTSLRNYDSVADFLKAKRKRNKDAYKADDSWQLDDGTMVKVEPNLTRQKKRAERRMRLLKMAIDFPLDDQTTPILSDDSSYSAAIPIGGLLDRYLPEKDLEGKGPEELNFGRDYAEEFEDPRMTRIDRLLEQFLTPQEPGLLGRNDKLPEPEELDADKTKSNLGQDFGNTESGNTSLTDNPII